jgi:hypothetical protein
MSSEDRVPPFGFAQGRLRRKSRRDGATYVVGAQAKNKGGPAPKRSNCWVGTSQAGRPLRSEVADRANPTPHMSTSEIDQIVDPIVNIVSPCLHDSSPTNAITTPRPMPMQSTNSRAGVTVFLCRCRSSLQPMKNHNNTTPPRKIPCHAIGCG